MSVIKTGDDYVVTRFDLTQTKDKNGIKGPKRVHLGASADYISYSYSYGDKSKTNNLKTILNNMTNVSPSTSTYSLSVDNTTGKIILNSISKLSYGYGENKENNFALENSSFTYEPLSTVDTNSVQMVTSKGISSAIITATKDTVTSLSLDGTKPSTNFFVSDISKSGQDLKITYGTLPSSATPISLEYDTSKDSSKTQYISDITANGSKVTVFYKDLSASGGINIVDTYSATGTDAISGKGVADALSQFTTNVLNGYIKGTVQNTYSATSTDPISGQGVAAALGNYALSSVLDNYVLTSSVTDTYSSSGTAPITGKGVASALSSYVKTEDIIQDASKATDDTKPVSKQVLDTAISNIDIETEIQWTSSSTVPDGYSLLVDFNQIGLYCYKKNS